MNSFRRPQQLFYGWWIVAASMGIQILIGGLMFQAYGSYMAVLREEFGWSKTLLSAAFSMSRVESGMLGPLQGWMIDRFGPRIMVRIGLVIMGLGFILFSQIHSPVTFFLTFFLIAVGSSLAGFMTLTVGVVNWFERRRALALGLMSTGFAVGGLIVPLVVFSLQHFGWRNTAFASGLIIIGVGQLLATVLRHRPEQYGYTVDGLRGPRSPAGDGTSRPARLDFTPREALRTPAFWYISLGHASALLVVSAVMVHLVIHINESLGYSLSQAGLVIALMTAFQIVGQIGGGVIGDRFNKRAIVVACMAGHAVALLFLAYATAFWMILVFALIHGLAWGGRGPLMQAIRADYFGRASFGAIMGFSSLIVMIGMTLGPIIAGVLADQTGEYKAGFTLLAALAGMGSIFFILARPPSPPDRATASEERDAGLFGVETAGGDG